MACKYCIEIHGKMGEDKMIDIVEDCELSKKAKNSEEKTDFYAKIRKTTGIRRGNSRPDECPIGENKRACPFFEVK